MNKLDLICVIVAVVAIGAATITILLYQRKMRHIMNNLNIMLNSAINGDFSESVFDESALSAVETKMTQYLSCCVVSSKNLTEEKNKIKGLISDISHQTKTPIANILLYSQLLSEYELPENCSVCVKALSYQAEKLSFLIGALVKISRLETGIITVNPKKQSIQKLFDTAISEIKPKSQAKEISLQVEQTDITAYLDIKWTTEAIYNILDNAVKYSPAKSIIKMKALPYELFCRIDITDEGIGIAEEEQSKIFSRFYRSPAVSNEEGVGIGLFLSREIIISAGGYIKVSSKPGQGSTFSVFLPTEKR
nr:HAMP domain-containing sensor histidine kinase [uncultured Aminipila sp.]